MTKSLSLKLNILLLAVLIFSLFTQDFIIVIGIIATIPVVISAIYALIHKKVTVDLLASIALAASLVNHEWHSVAFINLMITSARIFGDYTEDRAQSAIKSLLKLRPEKVKIKVGKEIQIIPVEKVKLHDLVVIETGDRVPVDGVIIEGVASINQSSLTGESLPVSKIVGQKVLSSTLCESGSLIVKTEKVGKDTTLEKIIALVESAQAGKLGIQTTADKFASIYISIMLIVSVALYFLTHNLNLILSVLLVACADDIAIAIPMAFWGAIAKAASSGIIIKGGSFVEGLANIKTLMVDKTGTLTRGTIRTEKIVTFGKLKSHEALKIFGSIESVSEHPIAKAIVHHAVSDGIKILTPTRFEEVPGKGIKAVIDSKKIVVGNLRFIKEEGIKINNDELKEVEKYEAEGNALVFLAINSELHAFITLADQIRPNVRVTIERLRTLGVSKVIMLTGDNEKVAAKVARETGITDYYANLLPEDKLKHIKGYLGQNGKLAMVGDGVNDAASLAASDIGIAMGAIGTDSAIEAADVALMQDNFGRIADAIALGKYTSNIARQNFTIWGIVNIVGLVLVFRGILGPGGAAAYNFITDFFPILNSMKVFRYKI